VNAINLVEIEKLEKSKRKSKVRKNYVVIINKLILN